MTNPTQLVQLKNGTSAPKAVISTTMIALQEIADTDGLALYDLVCACRDSSYAAFGDNGSKLAALALVERVNADGTLRIHDVVRNIVLSAAAGDELDMTLGSPV